MGTRIYHIISTNEHEDYEEQKSHDAHEDDEERNEKFEMSAHTQHRKDGKSEVHFKDKVTLKDEDYYKYIAKYGHHFSKKLSEHLVEELITPTDKIPYDKVEEILKQSDEELDEGHTLADLHYVANAIKARHSNSTVKSDVHVVMLAIEYLNDPNKSEGETFCEWFDSLKRKEKKVSWNKFM